MKNDFLFKLVALVILAGVVAAFIDPSSHSTDHSQALLPHTVAALPAHHS